MIFNSRSTGILYAVIMASASGFAVLVALAALGKKPILTLILDILMAASFYSINWDFVDRRIMPNANRVWGLSHYLYYPIAALIAVGAIWMFISKHKEKRAALNN